MKLLFSFVLVSAVLVSPASAQQPLAPDLAQHWHYDSAAPLNIKEAGARRQAGVTIHDITYESPVGERARYIGPNGGRVTAFLVVPAGRGPFPAVIYGHWCMPGSSLMNRNEFLDEAVLLAQSGVISLLPDHVMVHPGFVPDRSPLPEQDVRVLQQQVINLRRGADLLLARPDVDRGRLAYVGHSCDGTAGEVLSGVEKRFKTVVIMAGDLADGLLLKMPLMKQYREHVGPAKFDAFAAKYAWTDTGKYIAHAAPVHLFLQYADHEPAMTPQLEKEFFAMASQPKRFKLYHAEHALNPAATADRVAFLAQQLKFTAPKAEAIAKLPALVQPPWPAEMQPPSQKQKPATKKQ